MHRPIIPEPRQALAAMLAHAAKHAPFYRAQAWAGRMRAGQEVVFRDIPITPKDLVRERTAEFFSGFVPPAHGEVRVKPTSGSTGEPMEIRKTDCHFEINVMENQRLKSGWGYGDHRRVVDIGMPNDTHPIGMLEEKDLSGGGRSWKLYTGETEACLELIRRTSATLVTASPSFMLAVLESAAESSETLPLRLISTVQEVVPDELRELVRRIPGCRLADMYGCVEAGLIAGQCPLCDAYHPADRHLILEVITDEGHRARPGEMGRVLVTPLFNRAMPLIRYETGDYAVLAEKSDCPRSPMALTRIVGRERNLFKLPGGGKVVPRIPHRAALDLDVRKFKLIQTSLTDVEMHYIPKADDVLIAQDRVQDMIDRYMAPGFTVRCVRVSELPRAPSGKYLMHESLV